MTASLIRARTLITRVTGRDAWEELTDGAVLQADGLIQEIGAFAALQARHPTAPVLGTGREVMIPGLVNAHHHVGLTPLQLGSPDMPLELWWVTRMAMRRVDPYLDTLYSAFEMIASGVTTVQHIHGWAAGTLAEVEAQAGDVLRAYEEIGMRVSYCMAVREQNRLVYADDAAFVASLPAALRGPAQRWFDRMQLRLGGFMELFEHLHARHRGARRTRIQLAPANLHWCSDHALETIGRASMDRGVPMHMHLLETAYQKEYARRRGGSAVAQLDQLGLLGPLMTIGHGTWLTDADIGRLAETGTCVCHNCSSNFRLRSGLAPVNALRAAGVTLALGIDEAGLNDDRDMLQEMRVVLRAHRVPGMEDADVPSPAEVFRMATEGGARTTGFGDAVGTLRPGGAADLVLLDPDQFAYPYLDPLTRSLYAIVQRGKAAGVRLVMCGGEVIHRDGRFTRLDQAAVLAELHAQLGRALAPDEQERRGLAASLLPHVREFYRSYLDDAGARQPFSAPNSRK